MKLLKTARGTILDVYVKPDSKEFKMQVDEDELVVFCRETPMKGKVNKELIKELSRLFKKSVEIISGFSSRQKKILIKGIETKEVEKILDVLRS
jgi:uncharacterized protein (TIGR00251 family)